MESIDKVKGTFGRRVSDSDKGQVSVAVIRRLPRYHRYLGDLLRAGRLRISSAELSKIMGVTASQIRQDFNCFGGFGQQGYGYNVKYLYGKISELLGVEESYNAIIVGAGNLGKALVSSHMFERRGVTRLAMFDVNENVIGTTVSGIKVLSMDELEDFCNLHTVDIAVLTTPKECAAEVLDRLFACGVKGVWNFSNTELKTEDKDRTILNMHMGDFLMTLCYEIKKKEDKGV